MTWCDRRFRIKYILTHMLKPVKSYTTGLWVHRNQPTPIIVQEPSLVQELLLVWYLSPNSRTAKTSHNFFVSPLIVRKHNQLSVPQLF